MSRIFLPFVLFLYGFSLTAAQFQPFQAGQTRLYQFNAGLIDQIHAVQVDSAFVQNGDSHFVFNRIYHNSFPTYWLNRDNLFGREMIKQAGGVYQFVSSAPDTFTLETQVPLGSTWSFHDNVTATLQSIAPATVLGQADSVMEIALSNSYLIRLSQHYGLLGAPEFVKRDSSTGGPPLAYQLIGAEELGLGDSLPRFEHFFDYEIGDFFQYRNDDCPTGPPNCSDRYRDFSITGKNFTGADFLYTVMREELLFTPMPPGMDTTYTPPFQSSWDFLAADYPHLNFLPGSTDSSWIFRDVFFTGGIITYNFIPTDDLVYDPNSDAWTFTGTSQVVSYRPGLGLISDQFTTGTGYSFTDLLCYRLANDSAGSCLDLGDFAVGLDLGALDDGLLQVSPSPFQDQVKLDLSTDFSGWIRILDLQGRICYEQSGDFEAGAMRLNTASWSPGLYFLQLEDRQGRTFQRKLCKAL